MFLYFCTISCLLIFLDICWEPSYDSRSYDIYSTSRVVVGVII